MGTHSVNYQIDLDPNIFGKQTDAMFHLGESYDLAHGELDGTRWECRLANCGKQHLLSHDKDGRLGRLVDNDVLEKYDTDKKLWKAIDNRQVELICGSWWEVEFYRVDNDSHWYLDLFTDNSEVVDSPADAIRYVEFLLQDKPFIKDFKAALKGGVCQNN